MDNTVQFTLKNDKDRLSSEVDSNAGDIYDIAGTLVHTSEMAEKILKRDIDPLSAVEKIIRE